MQYCDVYLKIAAPNSPSTGSMNGDIVFTPDNERGSVWSEGDTITPSATVRCELSNGVLMYNGNSKVQLMAGGHTVNPEKVYWRVAFENITLGEEPVQIDPFVFEAIPGETIDLARVTPVMGYTPPGVIRGAAGLKFLGVVNSASDLPSDNNQGDAYVNIANKSIFIWDGSKWEEIEDFASVDGNVETFNTVLAQANDAAQLAEYWANETIQQVEGDFATKNYADSKDWVKRELSNDEDLNTLTNPGIYTVGYYSRALSLVNRPTDTNAIDRCSIEVLSGIGGTVQQTWYPMGAASKTDMPVMRRRRDTDGTWTEWERINAFTPAKDSYIMQSISAAKWEKRALVRDEDLDIVVESGLYYVPTYAIANSLINRPGVSTAVNPATIEVHAMALGQVRQVWTTLPGADRPAPILSRWRDNANVWTEWEEVGAKLDVPDYDPLEAVGMVATGASGELTGLRSVLHGLTPGAAPVWSWWAPAPTEELEIPTHDGGGQTCHPSVLYFPDGWNGWKYWMAHTPYPNFQEAHEDPNIAVSNDGTTWQAPEGLTNPLDDGLGRPDYHNSDAHLVMNGNTMVVTWRTVDRPNGGQNIIYARTSTDGVNWTAKTEVLKVPLGSSESTFVSQSLVKMPTGWRLYGIRSNYGPNRLGYYETSVETLPKTSDWGAAQDCDLGDIPTGRDPWHSEVQRLAADDWVAVISDGRRGSTGVDGDIYLARSTDGVAWDVSPLPLTPRANGAINSLYKTGFVVSGTGANRKFDLWVSGYRTDKRTWGIYRTLAEYRGPNQAAKSALEQRISDEKWERTPLSTGDDLNSLEQSGVYEINRGYIMSSLLNRPEGAGNRGVIEHVVSGDVKFQRLIHSTTSQVEIWQRVFYGGQWSTWERVNPPKAERLTTGTDLDSLVEQKIYQVPNFTVADSLTGKPDNIPGAVSHAVIEVLTNGSRTVQRWTTLPTAATKSITATRHRDTAGEWSTWVLASIDPDSLFMDRGVVSTGTDLNTLVSVGFYRVNNFTAAQSFVNGPPENARHRAVITVTATGRGEIHQRWQRMSQVGQPQTEVVRHRDEAGTWSEWMRPWELAGVTFGSGSGGGSTEDPFRIDKLRQNSRIRRGGIVGTGGRTPIALTFDHGFAKFRDLLLPHIIRLGLPCTVAFNSDTMGVTENEGVEWANLEQWCLQHGIEIAHHGRLHMSVDDALTNQAAVEHQFLSTIDDIRNNCPYIIADAFILPGSGGGGHEGFGNGLDDEGDSLWWSHPVGRTILSNFPVVTGDLLGVTVPATGTPVQTMDRISVDYNSGIITGRDKIRSCYGTNLGGVLFMHPNLLDDGTHTDAYRMVDFLEWLASERDAGNIEVLTLSGFAWATADSTRRFDLMRDKWVGDSATADLDLIQWIRGAQIMVTTTATSDGPLTITAADDSGNLAASITHDALAGEVYRLVFSIPKTANTITVTTAGTDRSVGIV